MNATWSVEEYRRARHGKTMEQMSEKKRRSSLRIAIALGVLVLFWYVTAMFVVLQS